MSSILRDVWGHHAWVRRRCTYIRFRIVVGPRSRRCWLIGRELGKIRIPNWRHSETKDWKRGIIGKAGLIDSWSRNKIGHVTSKRRQQYYQDKNRSSLCCQSWCSSCQCQRIWSLSSDQYCLESLAWYKPRELDKGLGVTSFMSWRTKEKTLVSLLKFVVLPPYFRCWGSDGMFMKMRMVERLLQLFDVASTFFCSWSDLRSGNSRMIRRWLRSNACRRSSDWW